MAYKKRKSISIKQKIGIIHEIERTGNQALIVKRLGLSSSTISRIWKDRENIQMAFSKRSEKTKKLKSSMQCELEEKLLLWMKEVRATEVVPITTKMLFQKAINLSKELKIENGFECTESWIQRFKKRYSISKGKIVGEAKEVDISVSNNFLQDTWEQLRSAYADCDIFNADETGLFYKCMPNTTLKFKGESCIGGKLSKERLTVLLCASATGEKIQPMIIGKFNNPRCFKNRDISSFNYAANKKAWMTSSLFIRYLNEWDSRLRMKNRKILLALDNCSAHPDINQTLTNIKLCFLPPNTTSVLQPLDQGIIKNFKVHYREILLTKKLMTIDENKNFHLTILDAIEYIKRAWDSVTQLTIANCFKHSGLIKKTEDPLELTSENLQIEEQSENLQILKNVLFTVPEQAESFMNIDQDIICHEQLNEEPEEENTMNDEDEVELPKTVTPLEANDGLQVVKNFFSSFSNSEKIHNLILELEKEIDKKYLETLKPQKTLFDFRISKN